MKLMNKTRNRAIFVGSVITVSVFVIFLMLHNARNKVVFQYKGEIANTGELDVICGSDAAYDASSIQLTALYGDEDITSEIQMVEQQEESRMIYKVRESEFILTTHLQDTQAPTISGPSEITILVNEAFDSTADAQNIRAEDTCDGNLDDKILVEGSVDIRTPNDTTIVYKVSDLANNEATHEVRVHVIEEKLINEPKVSIDIIYHDGIADPRSITPEVVKNSDDVTTLVNKFHVLQDGWAPNDLISITSNNGTTMQLRKVAAEAWERLNAKAVSDGLLIKVVSAYRTQAYQGSLFNRYLSKDPVYAFKYSAMPRRSEHELGLAIDISYDGYLYSDLQDSDIGKWMSENAAQFGFILRYMQGKEASTQYAYEAWHYRYVGVDLAKILRNRGITLEEYYGE